MPTGVGAFCAIARSCGADRGRDHGTCVVDDSIGVTGISSITVEAILLPPLLRFGGWGGCQGGLTTI